MSNQERKQAMRAGLLLVVPLALAGCTFKKTDIQNEAEARKYDSATMARVRLISGQGAYAGFVSGQSCEQYFNVSYRNATVGKAPEGWNPARTAPKGESLDAFGMPPSAYQNNVIGMPASTVTATIDDTRRYYDEHVVPAGQPLIAFVALVTSNSSCSSAPVSFIPQAGKDYEVRQVFKSDWPRATCRNAVYELGTKYETPVSINYCFRDKSGDFRTVSGASTAPISQ
ncbi:hypothetical protein [Pseudomonas sp. C9-3]|uniref:hypothetical protein n=1 Tax=Pseudomonas sp. C9-3 TaxID=3078264 RepID=UPI0028EDE8FB|nr:hypothetical protein [Pseudomonas sp. C9-3]